jgi:hypothetical protein
MLARLSILAALLASAASAQPSSALFAQVDEMLHALSQITGWKVKQTVPAEILPKEKFAKMVAEDVKDAEGNKETHATEITLKMFGLVPQDFNLAQESGDLITEQAAAFYDYKKKRLFVIESTGTGGARNSNEELLELAHELAHALADQQHSLKKYLNDTDHDDEAATARQAVIEGQASWLSWAYLAQRSGGKAEVPARLLDQLADSAGGDGDGFPVFTQAPLYIRESLTFPYTDGMRFQDAIYHKLGQAAFERVLAKPPVDSQQILHPDEYLESKAPMYPDPPALESVIGKDAKQFRVLTDGEVGEFDFSVLLRQYTNDTEGRDAASHWRGGFYRLYENKKDKYPVLAHASVWDSPEAAKRVFELYQEVLHGKWKKLQIDKSSETQVTGTGDSGRFWLRLVGNSVQSIEGIQSLEGVR